MVVGLRTGHAECDRTHPIDELTNYQLAHLLNALVFELVARDCWVGPAPSYRVDEHTPGRPVKAHTPVV
jgi:hypothetical protein